MEQNALFEFSIYNVLEIILIFESNGTIVYANRMAEEQLEFEDGLRGRKITEIFPGEFEIQNDTLLFHFDVDDSLKRIMAYRGNRTCFPIDLKLLEYETPAWTQAEFLRERTLYICTGYDASDKVFLERKASNAGKEV